MKKGQITIFLIIGLLIVAMLAFFLIMSEDFSFKKETTVLLLDNHIKLCEEQSTNCMLYRLGTTSGKMSFSEGPLPLFNIMEHDAATYLKTTPQSCFTFNQFPEKEVTVESIGTEVRFNHKTLQASFTNGITSKEKQTQTKAKDHIIKKAVQVKPMYDQAVAMRKPSEISDVPDSYISLDNYEFDVEIMQHESMPVISLIDTSSNIDNQAFRFYFLKE